MEKSSEKEGTVTFLINMDINKMPWFALIRHHYHFCILYHILLYRRILSRE